MGTNCLGFGGVGHFRESLVSWALQGQSGVGESGLGTQGHSGTLCTLGCTPETLQGHSGVGHSRDERGVDREI